MIRTVAKTVLSARSGQRVEAGDYVCAEVDLVYITDASATSVLNRIERLNDTSLADPSKVALVIDHYVPAPTAEVARIHGRMRRFANDTGALLVEEGEGICHTVLGEMGLVEPGDLIIGADSHTVTYGEYGALATGVGSTDAAVAMTTGRLWFEVPETIHIVLEGSLPPGSSGRDLALHLNRIMGLSGASYRCVEIWDEDSGLSRDDLRAVCNTSVEWGAKAAVVPESKSSAPDEADVSVNLDDIEPKVALPHAPHRTCSVNEATGSQVNLCFVGTCAGGSLADIRQAATILQHSRVRPGTRLLVAPCSRRIYAAAAAEGLVNILLRAGAVILPPCCGPCCGALNGVPEDGETVISTGNRNYRGRMGNGKSEIYLASALTVAASAAAGEITDPREDITKYDD